MTADTKVSLAEALADAATVATAEHAIYLDGAAYQRGKDLRVRIRTEQTRAGDDMASQVPALRAELDQVQAAIEASELRLTFKALPKTVFDKLLNDNPSSDKSLKWDPFTFTPALLAASCVGVSGVWDSDTLTLPEANTLIETLNDAQVEAMFRAAYGLQVEQPRPFTLAASEPTTSGVANSTIASLGDSLTPGS